MLLPTIILTSEVSCGRYLRHPISSLRTGMDSFGHEQQKDAIDDTSCNPNEEEDDSEANNLMIEKSNRGFKNSQTCIIPSR
jgi:hypothetical protein